MIDDCKSPAMADEASGRRMVEEMIRISHCRVPRKPPQIWAHNLRLLAYDASDSDEQSEDAQEQLAWESGPSSIQGCQMCMFERKSAFIHECDRWNEKSCTTCRQWTAFPEKVASRKLRLVKPKPPAGDKWGTGNCSHYVAISYRWPSPNKEEKQSDHSRNGSYSIRLEDGTIRKNQAPDEILDRAIAYAALHQLRFIWIDQECIDQSDTNDKELGIQSMDTVFERALHPVGIITHTVLNSVRVQALSHLWTCAGEKSLAPTVFETLEAQSRDIFDSVESLANDPWNWRAWVFQEKFSAARNMILLFTLDGMFSAESDSLFSQIQGSDDLTMSLRSFHRLIGVVGLYAAHVITNSKSTEMKTRARELEQKLRWLYPEDMERLSSSCSGSLVPNRQSCNAAAAVTYLRSKDLSRTADKLAIIANLCDWDIRLNTSLIEQHHSSLSLCVLVLALLNGDYSLLCADVYGDEDRSSSQSEVLRQTPLRNGLGVIGGLGSGLLASFTYVYNNLSKVSLNTLDPDRVPARRPIHPKRSPEISHAGLGLVGQLWKVFQQVDLSTVQAYHQDRWLKLKFLSEAKADDDGDDSVPDERRDILCDILWSIMCALDEDTHSPLADAIWQSLRRDATHVHRSGSREAGPDPRDMVPLHDFFGHMDKGDTIAKHQLIQLDRGQDGRFQQEWLVHRVMEQGHLWYASAVNKSTDEVVHSTSMPIHAVHQQSKDSWNKDIGKLRQDIFLARPGNPPSVLADKASGPTQMTLRLDEKNIEELQLLDTIMHEAFYSMSGSEEFGIHNAAAMTQFTNMITRARHKGDDTNLPRYAIFDVDHPALVLTPFDERLETLPHPITRSMDCCWVVDPAEVPGLRPDDGILMDITENFTMRKSVRGMWKITPNWAAPSRYNMVLPYRCAREQLAQDHRNFEDQTWGVNTKSAEKATGTAPAELKVEPSATAAVEIPEQSVDQQESDSSGEEQATPASSTETPVSVSPSPTPPPAVHATRAPAARSRRARKSAKPPDGAKAKSQPSPPPEFSKMQVGIKHLKRQYDISGISYLTEHVEEITKDKDSEDKWFKAYTLCIVHRMDMFDQQVVQSSVRINHQATKDLVRDIIGGIPGYSISASDVSINLPPRPLFHWRHELRRGVQKLQKDDRVHGKVLLDYISETFKDVEEEGGNLCKAGLITYELLWTLFRPGTTILSSSFGEPQALKVQNYEYMGGQSPHLSVCTSGVDYDGTNFGVNLRRVAIPAFEGSLPITSLSAYPMGFQGGAASTTRQVLIARGRRFAALAGQHLRHYEGIAFQGQDQFSVDSRVMIDCKTYSRINPNSAFYVRPFISRSQASGKLQKGDEWMYKAEEPKENSDKESAEALTDEQCLLASPTVRGFSLNDKRWFLFRVEQVSEIDWNPQCFDQLVLPNMQKSMIEALVRNHTQKRLAFDDIVKGKGKGLIIVLHGPPGVGKTLTAECVAESTRRPLYMVSSGDLGSNSEDLDKRLSSILDLASTWKAVLLIDEADVFLERRSLQDMKRNGLVSIFLRVLEYYEGILFLTTNRIGTFDEAFKSRIHLPLKYSDLNVESRIKIWANFLEPLKRDKHMDIDDEGYATLGSSPLNGRQIKNIIRTATSLAEFRNERLSLEHLREVTETQLEFENDLGRT